MFQNTGYFLMVVLALKGQKEFALMGYLKALNCHKNKRGKNLLLEIFTRRRKWLEKHCWLGSISTST